MKPLVDKWRAWAKILAKDCRTGNYGDQLGRVLAIQEAKILRRCASALQRAMKK